MKDWRKIIVSPSTPINKVLEIIDKGSVQIVLVVGENEKLLGTVTDGDIRRGLLRGVGLNDPVEQVYFDKPVTASINDSAQRIRQLMAKRNVRQIPVLDTEGRVVGVELLKDHLKLREKTNPVVLMAGGLGTRLRPMTESCPKPLLKVGGKPILEIILDNLIDFGFSNFYISLNYKGEMIEDHFGVGASRGVEIKYLRENKRMGTAGALGLIPEKPETPLIIMNGDLLTKINFDHLLNFHENNQAKATMCVKEYVLQVPYGVVKIDQHRFVGLDEKPTQRFFVNAGIYVIEPDIIDYIPKNIFFDMTDLFQKLADENFNIVTFPVHEYWMDIGYEKDFEKANVDFQNNFCSLNE